MRRLLPLVLLMGCATVQMDTVPPEKPKCDCDYEAAKRAERLKVVWQKAFDGERPDDTDLQAYQDAIEILECVAKQPK